MLTTSARAPGETPSPFLMEQCGVTMAMLAYVAALTVQAWDFPVAQRWSVKGS